MASMVDDRTSYLDLPLPHVDNPMTYDVPRLRAAATALDAKAQQDDELHSLFSDELAAINERMNVLEAVVPGEESQVLAASQTVVNLTTMATVAGASVFIEGVRLKKTEWTPHATVLTRLTLAASYPAGHEITVVR